MRIYNSNFLNALSFVEVIENPSFRILFVLLSVLPFPCLFDLEIWGKDARRQALQRARHEAHSARAESRAASAGVVRLHLRPPGCGAHAASLFFFLQFSSFLKVFFHLDPAERFAKLNARYGIKGHGAEGQLHGAVITHVDTMNQATVIFL